MVIKGVETVQPVGCRFPRWCVLCIAKAREQGIHLTVIICTPEDCECPNHYQEAAVRAWEANRQAARIRREMKRSRAT
jgi:hypothetical protein